MSIKKRFRDTTHRRPNWDYSDNGYYFVTLVTADRKEYFGEIVNGNMELNPFGEIALNNWNKSFEIRNELFCDEFVIMPNHIHAILIIDKPNINEEKEKSSTESNKNFGIAERKPKSISSFMAGYKSAVLNDIDDYIDLNHPDYPKFNRKNPLWQSNYHDRIIRNTTEYQRIKLYIQNNPKNWMDDELN